MGDDRGVTLFTERMVPEEAHPRIFWEHIERYRFARDFVAGKRVLDVACGEGYGAAALGKAGALSVIGVDISAETCARAKKYGIDARPGDAQAIPLPDRSIDVIVSFETIEHVPEPTAFLGECLRVLVPGGTLIVSSPNRPVYSQDHGANPYHRIEFDEAEFAGLLRTRFAMVQLYSQFAQSAAWWSPRSLAAERSPWMRVRGFWRLSAWICPTIRTDLSPADRESAVQLILGRSGFPRSLFNPYVVRPRSKRSRERPYILVAVARRPRLS